jgi:uncharacterized protein
LKDRVTRLQYLVQLLETSEEPVTGTELANHFKVTRQVVVHDIALLRAQGCNIVSTPRGYIISSRKEGQNRTIIAVSHTVEQTATELYIFADYGISVLDVQVEHPIYGQLTGCLQLSSRRDVELFMEKVSTKKVTLLSSLTGGYHFHTIQYGNEERLQEAVRALRDQKIQVFD